MSTPRSQAGRWQLSLIDPWREAFVIELRLRAVAGRHIGDLLAEVDAHCAESGEDPLTAFGEPREYAAVMAGAQSRPSLATPWPELVGQVARGGASIAGGALLLAGLAGLVHGGGRASVSNGLLCSAVVSLAVFTALLRRLDLLVTRPVRGAVALATAMAILVLPAALWHGTALTMPAWVALLVGAVLGAAVWLGAARTPDRIVDPRTGQEPEVGPRWSLWAVWALPLAMLLAGVAAALW